jgi:SET domain-containing protein
VTTIAPRLYVVKKVPKKGRACIAIRRIKKGTIIMVNQMVGIPRREHKHISETVLARYRFSEERKHFIILGNISIVNHSNEANTDFRIYPKTLIAKLVATKDIAIGEELFINYGHGNNMLRSHYGIHE